MSAYIATILVFVGIFAVLAWTYDLLLGAAGIFSVAHIAFYGIGAYCVALLMLEASFPFIPALLVGLILNGIIAAMLGYMTTRLVGDYLVVATLGLHYVVVDGILPNWQSLTGGFFGLFGIPQPGILGWQVRTPWEFAALTGIAAVLVGLLFFQLDRSRFGLALKAIRDDEISAAALGYPVAALKTAAFTISSSVVVVASAIYASFIGYIDPPTFDITLVILIIAMVVVGGSGTILGPLCGAIILVGLPDLIVFLSRSSTEAVGPLRQVFYGLALIGFALFRPSGIVPAKLPKWRITLADRN